MGNTSKNIFIAITALDKTIKKDSDYNFYCDPMPLVHASNFLFDRSYRNSCTRQDLLFQMEGKLEELSFLLSEFNKLDK